MTSGPGASRKLGTYARSRDHRCIKLLSNPEDACAALGAQDVARETLLPYCAAPRPASHVSVRRGWWDRNPVLVRRRDPAILKGGFGDVKGSQRVHVHAHVTASAAEKIPAGGSRGCGV